MVTSLATLTRMIGRGLAAGLALLAFGCGTPVTVGGPGIVHDIQITSDAKPTHLRARIGDGVRWHNLTSRPITVGILESKWLDGVTCENGFRRFSRIDDIVTIKPGRYVSLCFAHKGTVQYNVWLNQDDMRGSMTPTATIMIDEARLHHGE